MEDGDVRGWTSHRWLVGVCGGFAALAGGAALLGWTLDHLVLAGLGAERIPMAPSTAVLFVLYGVAVVLRARVGLGRGARRFGVAVYVGGAIVSVWLLASSSQGIYLESERLGFAAEGLVGGVPIGHMSPVTAIGFLVATVAFLGSLPPFADRRGRAIAAWWLACGLIMGAAVLLLAYLYGTPFLYGGFLIPPAVTTTLAFGALGVGLAALASSRVWPAESADAVRLRSAPVLVLVLLLFAAGIVTAGYLYLRSSHAHARLQAEESLESIAELKADHLVAYRRERLGDGLVFFRNAAFSALVERSFEDPADVEAAEQLHGWLEGVQTHYQYDRLVLLDAEGVERMAVPEPAVPLASVVKRRAAAVLESGRIELVDFHRSEHDQRVYLATLVPIFDGPDWARPLGVLVLRIDPQTYVYPLLGNWPIPSDTAETALVRREGGEVVFLGGLRFREDAPLTLRVPLEREDLVFVRAALGEEGVVEGIDDRGVPVIAALRAVPDSPWILVARIDAAELAAPLRQQMWMTIVLVAALVASAVLGVGATWRQQRVRFYRERYEAERERAWMSEVIARSLNEVWVFDPDTLRFSFVNRGARGNIGYSPEELARMTPLDVEPDFDEASFRVMLESLRRGERDLVVFDTVHRRKDGSRYPVEVNLQYVAAADHPVFLAVINDVSERLEMEAELRQAQRMEAVGRLAGGIAHDFNNQIFVINGYCDLLLADPSLPPAVLQQVEEIGKAARRSAALTAQLLAFSRRQVLQPKVLDINAELLGVESMLRRLIGESVELTFLPGNVGHAKVDPGQLQQVMVNLALNARDAMPQGGTLTIETGDGELDEEYARSHLEVRPGPYVVLSVSDTGRGMDAETLGHVFEPFFTTKALGQGTGLGLATVHGIVRQSGGHIAIYSEVAHGTTVRVYLPRVDEPLAASEGGATEALARGTETILVVEDEPAVRELVRRILDAHGYRVLVAASGVEALKLAAEIGGRIHLLLTDVVMPEMSGPTLAERLHRSHPEVRVLFMSGYTENAIGHHGVLAAGLAFVPKPCPTDVLLRRVRETIDARPPADVRGRRVLLVDDSENERALGALVLSKAGCTVLEAASGSEALAVLDREAVDAVITDVNMPGMSGFDLTEAIRRSPRHSRLPVVILSGAYMAEDEERSRAVGATACLEKGALSPQGLLDVLARSVREAV